MNRIMYIEWGGLGDQLQFSNLPEAYKIYNNEDSYIHTSSEFRNMEIYELVWGTNPYIKGFSDEAPNAGSRAYGVISSNENMNSWSIIHGLPPGDGYPKIYQEPESISGYEDVILVDLIARSHFNVGSYNQLNVKEKINELKKIYRDKTFVSIIPPKNIIVDGGYHMYDAGFDPLPTKNLFNYFNLINSCFGIVSLHSGTHVLAATIKKRFNDKIKNMCIIPMQYYIPNSIYIYDNSEYLIF